MKRTLRNIEIENILSIIASPKSFRNNVEIKVPVSVDYAVRVNLKKLNERYEIFNEMRTELQREVVEAGKVNEEKTSIADEYLNEYNSKYLPLAYQPNEINFQPINKEDFEHMSLSMPERDFLMLMVEDEEIEKVEGTVE